MRINIVGTAGSGKTLFSRTLAQHYQLPHIELDALYWGPNWQPVPVPQFRDRVGQITTEPHWIIDGNYRTKARDLVWQRAQTVIWLDYPLPVILWRLCQRSMVNIYTRHNMWGTGSVETIRKQFLGRESFLLWALATHKPRRQRLLQAMHSDAAAHIDFVQLRSPLHAHMWLKRVAPASLHAAQAQSGAGWSPAPLKPILG